MDDMDQTHAINAPIVDRHIDFRPLGTEVDRVVHQIAHGLCHQEMLPLRMTVTRWDMEMDLQVLQLCAARLRFDLRTHQRLETQSLRMAQFISFFDGRKGQQTLDEERAPQRLSKNIVEETDTTAGVHIGLLEELCRSPDRCKW